MKQQLINKLNDKTAVIGIVGLGYAGIPLALRYAEAGYKVLGLDIDSEKIKNISSKNMIALSSVQIMLISTIR